MVSQSPGNQSKKLSKCVENSPKSTNWFLFWKLNTAFESSWDDSVAVLPVTAKTFSESTVAIDMISKQMIIEKWITKQSR